MRRPAVPRPTPPRVGRSTVDPVRVPVHWRVGELARGEGRVQLLLVLVLFLPHAALLELDAVGAELLFVSVLPLEASTLLLHVLLHNAVEAHALQLDAWKDPGLLAPAPTEPARNLPRCHELLGDEHLNRNCR